MTYVVLEAQLFERESYNVLVNSWRQRDVRRGFMVFLVSRQASRYYFGAGEVSDGRAALAACIKDGLCNPSCQLQQVFMAHHASLDLNVETFFTSLFNLHS